MTGFIWLAIAAAISLASPIFLYAQSPFECNGKVFRVVEENGGSTLQEVSIDEETLTMSTNALAFFPDSRINAVCYRSSDNNIYGLLLESPYVLCRIDGDHNLTRLKELPLPTNLTFVAGDISPDGRYLVLLGFSDKEPGNLLARVDLSQPSYPTEMLPLVTNDGSRSIACVDIAFHPTTNILYGFNHNGRRLITIDIEQKIIDNTSYPQSNTVHGNVPSIFFDSFGNLFGIGSTRSHVSSRSLLLFDTETGLIEVGQDLGLEGNQDGCSCPYTVDLLNIISPKEIFPCTETEIQLVIFNRTPFEQINIALNDTLPRWMEILEIDNPFGGIILNGVGANILDIEQMVVPIGVDTISLKVSTSEDSPIGTFINQAFLKNVFLRQELDGVIIPSDDPSTPVFDDPTQFNLNNLKVDFGNDKLIICSGDQLTLGVEIKGDLIYRWSTGENSETITVTQPGLYELHVQSNCQEASGVVLVKEDDIRLDLGPDRDIEIGERVNLEPLIQSNSDIAYHFWSEPSGRNDLICTTCPITEIIPHESTTIGLDIANENGCITSDLIHIDVHPFALYVPTAFSPNKDGRNDHFFLQGRTDYVIRSFQVFDRWGNIVFQQKNAFANQYLLGWDGNCNGKPMNAGLYVWQAEIDLSAGKIEHKYGEVMLVR